MRAERSLQYNTVNESEKNSKYTVYKKARKFIQSLQSVQGAITKCILSSRSGLRAF